MTRHIADPTGMAKIQRLCEKIGRMQIITMNRSHDPTRIVMSFGETLMLVVMADWTNMYGRNVPQVACKVCPVSFIFYHNPCLCLIACMSQSLWPRYRVC